MSSLTRRQFCVVTGAGVLAGACGKGSSSTADGGVRDLAAATDLAVVKDLLDPTCPMGFLVNVGPASSFVVNEARFFQCAQLFVLRDAGGIYAMSAVCTHEGCIINYAPATHDFGCPCHQSVFDFNGKVTMSPAMMPLPHYTCSLDANGNVIVDMGSMNVDPATRLAV